MAIARQTFISDQTWVVPADVFRVKVYPNPFPSKKIVICGTGVQTLDNLNNIWVWGSVSGLSGWKGDGVPGTTSSPTKVVGALQWGGQFSQLLNPQGNGYMIDIANNLWAAGQQNNGQLGNGVATAGAVSSPVKVIGGLKWQQLATQFYGGAGSGLFMGIDVRGNAWSFGATNTNGAFGVGDSLPRSSPVQVLGSIKWQTVSVGTDNAATILSGGLDLSGNAWMWGSNKTGGIGNGVLPTSVAAYSSPVQVVGGLQFKNLWVAGTGLATGISVIAQDLSNNYWGWGQNANGQLGNGVSGGAFSSPTQVIGGIQWASGPNQFAPTGMGSVGSSYTFLAIDVNQNAWAWGQNANSVGGTPGSIAFLSSPVQVLGGIKWAAVFGGASMSMGLDISGNLWAWGLETGGQLGNGTNTSAAVQSSPVQVSGNLKWSQYIAIDNGVGGWVGADLSGILWSCGPGSGGILGNNTSVAVSSPVQVFQGLTFQGPFINPSPLQNQLPSQYLDVVPGNSIPIIIQQTSQTFNGVPVGLNAQSITVEYEQ